MNNEYTIVEMQNHFRGPKWMEEGIRAEDIIFLIRSIDTTYDHASENLGHFCQVAHLRDGEMIWEAYNPGDSTPIDELISQAGDKLECILNHFTMSCYLGRPRADFRVDGEELIYLNKYCFKPSKEILDYFENSDFGVLVRIIGQDKK